MSTICVTASRGQVLAAPVEEKEKPSTFGEKVNRIFSLIKSQFRPEELEPLGLEELTGVLDSDTYVLYLFDFLYTVLFPHMQNRQLSQEAGVEWLTKIESLMALGGHTLDTAQKMYKEVKVQELFFHEISQIARNEQRMREEFSNVDLQLSIREHQLRQALVQTDMALEAGMDSLEDRVDQQKATILQHGEALDAGGLRIAQLRGSNL